MAEGRSSTGKYILIGCAIVLGLGVCGVGSCIAFLGGGAFLVYEQSEAPAAAARAFLQAVARDPAHDALDLTSSKLRARVTGKQLAAFVSEHPVLAGEISDITFSQRSVSGDSARVAGTVTTKAGQTGVELTLVREGESYRVDGLTVAGAEL